jgi:hypothetical protein
VPGTAAFRLLLRLAARALLRRRAAVRLDRRRRGHLSRLGGLTWDPAGEEAPHERVEDHRATIRKRTTAARERLPLLSVAVTTAR